MQDCKTKAQKKMVYRGVNRVVRDNTTRYNFFQGRVLWKIFHPPCVMSSAILGLHCLEQAPAFQ